MRPKEKDSEMIGRVPPQSIQLEEFVLGVLLLEGDSIIRITDILKPKSFYKSEHSIIFSAILKLFEKGTAIDIMTVDEQLRAMGESESTGGFVKLMALMAMVSSSSHLEEHAKIIAQKYMQREMIRISFEISSKAFSPDIDIDELFEYSVGSITNLQSGAVKKTARRLSDIGRKRLSDIEHAQKTGAKSTGIPSFKRLDAMTGGWQPGNLVIIAARPSMGKTRIGAQELARKAAESDHKVAIFSIEQQDEELYDRELSSQTGIENMNIRQAKLTESDWKNIEIAQLKIEGYDIYIDDNSTLTTAEFRAKAMLYVRRYGVDLIIVDYLQLMQAPEFKHNREREISTISSTLKSVAKQLGITVIALSQLSRKVEERADKTPGLHDLRESGSIEQDADMVVFIHRPEVYNKNDEDLKNKIILIVAKQRNGPLGDIILYRSERWSTIYESHSDYISDTEDSKIAIPETIGDLPF